LALALLAGAAAAQAPRPAPKRPPTAKRAPKKVSTPAKSSQLSPKQLQEDFRILRSALEEGHSGIYRYTPKDDLDRIFDLTLRKLDRPMDPVEFFRLGAPVVAAIKCGHTRIAPPPEPEAALFPFAIEVLAGKAYVFRDYSTADGRLAGSEIRSINGLPIELILSAMTTAMPGDGNIPTSRAWRVGRGGGFQRLLYPLLGIQGPFHPVLRTPEGKQESREVEGLPQSKLRELAVARHPSTHPGRTADFRLEDGGKIAVLSVHEFYGSAGDPPKPLDQYFPDAFRQIGEKGSKALIIDVRDNNGGADELGKQLFSFLWDQPFRYYSDLVLNARTFSFKPYMPNPRDIPADEVQRGDDGKYHNVRHPNLGIQPPSQPNFGGKVFILINGGSFSTTCEFTSTVHFHKRATFIGEEAGGAYYGNTSGYRARIVLPNTKLEVSIPLQTYYLAVSGYPQADRSVMPDYPVHDTIQDLLAGRDKEMELALKLARQ
jgi:hypothetical protein